MRFMRFYRSPQLRRWSFATVPLAAFRYHSLPLTTAPVSTNSATPHACSPMAHQLRLALLKRRAGPGGAANNKMKQLSTVQVYSSNKFSC